MIRPVNSPVSQTFGENPTKHLSWDSWLIQTFGNYQPDGHSGQDYACDVGTPVRAVTSGTVRHIGWMSGSYAENPWWIMPSFAGYVVVIDHGAFIGIYGHCKDGSGKVTKGQQVSEGQVIALSGNTGASTGPHLHFEILPDKYNLYGPMYGRIDPETLFKATIQTHSVTTTPAKPKGFLMALTDAQQDELYKTVKNTWAGVWAGGSYNGKKFNYGILPIVAHSQHLEAVRNAETQAQFKGLIGALAALSQGEKFDEAKLLAGIQAAAEAGVKAGLTDGVVTVDVNVTGAK